MNKLIALIFTSLLVQATQVTFAQKGWIKLFNGKDLKDWNIKIAKHDYNENYGNTFYVEDSMLKVKYDAYTTFDQQYGHIYYKKPFSHYLIRVEYRFVGEQAKGGEDWAIRNSGVMLHCQDPKTILKNQDFPISVEGQLLGGNGKDERPTGNVCTPGTTIEIKSKLVKSHCTNSTSKTFHGNQWVRAEFLVLGDSLIKHIINGDTVLSYTHPKIGGGNVTNYDPQQKIDGTALKKGYISLQSESHPIEFRLVELYNLEPYANKSAKLNQVLDKLRKEK